MKVANSCLSQAFVRACGDRVLGKGDNMVLKAQWALGLCVPQGWKVLGMLQVLNNK